MTKSVEILNGKLHFLCSVNSAPPDLKLIILGFVLGSLFSLSFVE